MGDYIVTARKWRPTKFEDVAGQRHVTQTLQNAIASGRIAHAYLFSGPRGVGKTTTARLLARAVNCLAPPDPGGECDMCRDFVAGRSFDIIEFDAASTRGIDQIRDLRDAVRVPPVRGRYKVYVIDEVHMLTKEAFNALLKTLEEPPPHALFVLATTEASKVPATILSRCQRFDFRRIGVSDIADNLRTIAEAEGITVDDGALHLLARKADGSLRDAQSLFDQGISLCGNHVREEELRRALHLLDPEMYFRVTDLVRTHDAAGALALVEELVRQGYDLREFLLGLAEHLRNLLVVRVSGGSGMLDVAEPYRKRYEQEAPGAASADLLRMIRLVGATENALRWAAQPRFRLETDMVQLVTMPPAADVRDLLARVEELKKKLDDGPARVPIVSAPGVPRPFPPPIPSAPPRRIPVVPRTSVATSAPAQAPGPQESPPFPSANGAEVAARWHEVIMELRARQKVSLASILETSRLLGVSGGAVRIACANDFQSSAIQRHRTVLTEVLQHLFNARVRVEVEVSAGPEAAGPGSGTPQPAPPDEEEHPVIRALKRELGAEPLT